MVERNLHLPDEIAEFKTSKELELLGRRSLRQPKYSAEGLYDSIRSSIDSRFSTGKLMLISYPRFKGDYIQQKYEENLTDPRGYASFGVTWDVNPTMKESDFDDEFRRSPERSKAKYQSLVGETLVDSNRGLIRLDTVSVGDLVATASGQREVRSFYNEGLLDCCKVKFKGGNLLIGSLNHPVLTPVGWKRLDELKSGSKVLRGDCAGVDSKSDCISREMAILLGANIADGSFGCRKGNCDRVRGRYYATWLFGEGEFSLLGTYLEYFKKEFGWRPSVKKVRGSKVWYFRTDRKKDCSILVGLGMSPKGGVSKVIPGVVFECSKKVRLGFIQGLVDSDGHVTKKGQVQYHTISKNVADGFRALLYGFGIHVSHCEWQPKVNKQGFGSKKGLNLVYSFKFSMGDSAEFGRLVSLRSSKGRNQITNYIYPKQVKEKTYEIVSSVESIGERLCYDIWVEPENEFLVNGLRVHNCDPGLSEDSFFKKIHYIDSCFPVQTDENKIPYYDELIPRLKPWFSCNHSFLCSLHLDLAVNNCRAGVALTHQYDVKLVPRMTADNELVTVEYPLVAIDFLSSFIAPAGGEIDFNSSLIIQILRSLPPLINERTTPIPPVNRSS